MFYHLAGADISARGSSGRDSCIHIAGSGRIVRGHRFYQDTGAAIRHATLDTLPDIPPPVFDMEYFDVIPGLVGAVELAFVGCAAGGKIIRSGRGTASIISISESLLRVGGLSHEDQKHVDKVTL